MPQGLGKLTSKVHIKSKGSQKHKVVRAKRTLTKGRKTFASTKDVPALREQADTSKAINRKNEALVAAKAVSVGSKFFLSDIAQKGTKEKAKQERERNKKQAKSKTKISDRLRDQLKKLEKKEGA